MFRLFAITLFFASPVLAESYVSDAFGILPATAISPERSNWAGLRDSEASSLTQPEDVDAVLIFIGPKALVAGKDVGHAVSLSFDRHGNLVQDTEARFSMETNGILNTKVRDGIADALFSPNPTAGTFAGGASVGDIQSPRALYRVTADLESAALAFGETPVLRAESFTTLASSELADQYGNPVEDGVGTTMILSHETGQATLLSAPVREAKAEAVLLGRDIESDGSASIHIASVQGSGAFEYQGLTIGAPPELAVWEIEEIGAVGLRLGPFTTTSGHLLTDGSLVEVGIAAEDGTELQINGWLQDGYFETVVQRPAESKNLTVAFKTVVGSETRVVAIEPHAPKPIRGAE
ncbi:MAG: hypothetical protein OXQ92_01090 [Boseongicola sp.]|nr:hypothetical protein [Boseongicola sp.]MDD9978257.1 hypothetical protein [Boseongicola sp.]